MCVRACVRVCVLCGCTLTETAFRRFADGTEDETPENTAEEGEGEAPKPKTSPSSTAACGEVFSALMLVTERFTDRLRRDCGRLLTDGFVYECGSA